MWISQSYAYRASARGGAARARCDHTRAARARITHARATRGTQPPTRKNSVSAAADCGGSIHTFCSRHGALAAFTAVHCASVCYCSFVGVDSTTVPCTGIVTSSIGVVIALWSCLKTRLENESRRIRGEWLSRFLDILPVVSPCVLVMYRNRNRNRNRTENQSFRLPPTGPHGWAAPRPRSIWALPIFTRRARRKRARARA